MPTFDDRRPALARLLLLGLVVLGPDARADDGPETTPITVRGQAFDRDGKVVAGAAIHLISTNGIDADLGTTTTDRAGNYLFRDAKLPVRRQPKSTLPASGTFQVYGTAPGLGFTWLGMRHYSGEPRPADWNPAGEDFSIFRGEPLNMDLKFTPVATLSGRVVDEAGRPVAGVKVQLRGCDFLDITGREQHHNYREFWGLYRTPEAMRTAKTDPDGRFRIGGLPQEVGFMASVEHPDYAHETFFAATTARRPDEFDYPKAQLVRGVERPAVETGPVNLTLRATRRVVLHVVFDDTGKPAPDISITAGAYGDGPSASGRTDAAGDLILKIPPGEHTLLVDPPHDGSNYVRSKGMVGVAAEPAEQSHEIRVQVGCVVILEAVDGATGEGLPDVIFMTSMEGKPGARTSVQSSTTWVDNPRTDAEGRLRIVSYPGDRAYSASHVQGDLGYQPVTGEKRAKLPPGGKVTLRFESRK